MALPETPDANLTRDRTADALNESGFPIKPKTLATMATRGGGPPYRRFGGRVLYRWGDALAWAQSRLTQPLCTTSELDIAVKQVPSHRHSTLDKEMPAAKSPKAASNNASAR